MRLFLLTLIWVILPYTIVAQKEQDFATRFMNLNSQDCKELTCSTVSPNMMERIMNLDTLEDNAEMRKVLAQLKSIQIVEAKGQNVGDSLFLKAAQLAQKNQKRYKLYTNDPKRIIYLRKRNGIIVEMVFIANLNNKFNIVNLTGNMHDSFIKELSKM